MQLEYGFVLLGYLIGSIPFGVLISKWSRGVDPRHGGSGSMGATNVLRVVGKKEAILTLLFDFCKGFFPVAAARFFVVNPHIVMGIGMAAVLGHIFPFVLNFKGGKGVTTSLGVILAVAPIVAVAGIAFWIVGAYLGKQSSVGALLAFLMLPVLSATLQPNRPFFIFSLLLSLVVLISHKDNFKRLIRGKERSPFEQGQKISPLLIWFFLLPSFLVGSVWGQEQEVIPFPLPSPVTNRAAAPIQSLNMAFPDDLLQTETMERLKTGHHIVHSELGVRYLLHQAEKMAKKDQLDEAFRLANLALQFSPASPEPNLFLAKLLWMKDKTAISSILTRYYDVVRYGVHDFWFILSWGQNLLIGAIYFFLAFLVLFSLYSFFSYSASWVHQIEEWGDRQMDPRLCWLIFTSICCIPFVLGFSMLWFVVFIFILFWSFYSILDRIIVIVSLIAICSAVFLIPILSFVSTARDLPFLVNLVKNQQEDFFWGPPNGLRNDADADWRESVIQASYEVQEGNFKKARQFYEQALLKQPDLAMAINNLGNVYFYLKDYPRAISSYEKAIRYAPLMVAPHFNLGQTYREMILFEKGEKKFSEAEAIDSEESKSYSKRVSLFPDFPVIEVRFTEEDVWNEVNKNIFHGVGREIGIDTDVAEKIWQGWVGGVPLKNAPFLVFLWFALIGIIGFFIQTKARFCVVCHLPICLRCQHKIFGYRMCQACKPRFDLVTRKVELVFLDKKKGRSFLGGTPK